MLKIDGLNLFIFLNFNTPDGMARPPSSTTAVISAARSAYSKLLSRLQPEFIPLTEGQDPWQSRYGGIRSDLIASLGLGLKNWIEHSEASRCSYVASQVSLKEAGCSLQWRSRSLVAWLVMTPPALLNVLSCINRVFIN